MAQPSTVEATELAHDDAKEAIGVARSGGGMQPIVTIADGAEHDAQTTGFHKRWWRQHDENWPAAVSDAYNEAFTRDLLAAEVAVVELQFDGPGGKWTNVGVVDLKLWEPTFPFDPEHTGWVQQDPRSRVGWRRRSVLRKLFSRKKKNLLALGCIALLTAPAAAGAAAPAAEEPSAPVGFELHGTHGWSIAGEAFLDEETDRGTITFSAIRGSESVFYGAPAKVTADSVHADLGSLGRVDLVLHKTGQVKTLDVKCLHHQESFEAGTWEGVVELDGEGGFTRARATHVAALPYLKLLGRGRICHQGGSSGESFGPGLPGARLAGVSYANGRTLKFTFNKNRPGGKTLFGATLSERRDGIRIYRELSGVVPSSAFHYDPSIRTATLSPPAPFAGSATLTRNRDSVAPLLTGNLALAFPGHTVALAGREVHVSLVHARLHKGNRGTITIGLPRLR